VNAQGEPQDKVFDIVRSGDRKPGKDGRLPPVGNSVDHVGRGAQLPVPARGRAGDDPEAGLDVTDLVHTWSMKKLLREPLLHFLLAGIALFLIYDFVRGGAPDTPRDIVITEARVEALAESFATVWMRPPTPQEIKGLIDDYVAEEIYYREAIAMGLDQDDTVIRRRLRQKMEFISEDAAAGTEPTDAELQAYLAKHAEKFVSPATLTFRQVYFSTEKHGDRARPQAEQLLGELQAGRGPVDLAVAGDPTLLPPDMQSASPQAIASTFGSEFAEQIEEVPVGQWSGPLQSGFGLHVVRVDERVAGALPAFDQIRPIVLREYQAEQRSQSSKAFLDGLRAKYDIRIEGPAARLFDPAGATSGAQGGGAK
jgi:hypothetical protein